MKVIAARIVHIRHEGAADVYYIGAKIADVVLTIIIWRA